MKEMLPQLIGRSRNGWMLTAGRISVREVETKRDWRSFFQFRREIYRDDPYVVFPLNFMERMMLDPNKHPFYQHASRQAFLAERSGKIVGRIAAIQDDMHNEYYSDSVGFFGFFECIDDYEVAGELMSAASNWLKKHGCDIIRGPVNPSMKSDFGLLVLGHDKPPFVMMAHTRSYYENLLLENRFEVIREFNAYFYDADETEQEAYAVEAGQAERREKIFSRYPKLRIGNVDRGSFESTLRDINELGNSVRSGGWGFVPLTEAELQFMIKQLKKVLDPETLLTAYWGDKLVGYCINVPDVNWALKKSVGSFDWIRLPQFLYWLRRTKRTRVIALGADANFRQRGVGILLSTEMRYRGLRSHFRQWEFSWIDTKNEASIRATGRTMPLDHYKTYRLYQRPIP